MRWLMEFYNERRGILARYGIEYPATPRRSRLSLCERAERVGGQAAGGWVLSRIVKDNDHGSPGAAQAHAT